MKQDYYLQITFDDGSIRNYGRRLVRWGYVEPNHGMIRFCDVNDRDVVWIPERRIDSIDVLDIPKKLEKGEPNE